LPKGKGLEVESPVEFRSRALVRSKEGVVPEAERFLSI